MGWWPDPWGELAYFEEQLLGMLSDKIGNVSNYLNKLWDSLKVTMGRLLESISGKAESLVSGITEAIKGITTGIGSALAGAFDGIMEPVTKAMTAIKDAISDISTWVQDKVYDTLVDAWEWIKDTWDGVKEFFANQYDLITGFWSDLFANLYFWLDEKLTEIWTYLTKVVIPAFMDALAYVFESEPVQWFIGFIKKHFIDAFSSLFELDEAELQKWAKKGAEFMRGLVETEPV